MPMKPKKEIELPPIDKVLVEELDRRFPGVYPDISWSDREIWFRAGQRNLVEFLLEHHRKQHKDYTLGD